MQVVGKWRRSYKLTSRFINSNANQLSQSHSDMKSVKSPIEQKSVKNPIVQQNLLKYITEKERSDQENSNFILTLKLVHYFSTPFSFCCHALYPACQCCLSNLKMECKTLRIKLKIRAVNSVGRYLNFRSSRKIDQQILYFNF